MVQEGIFFPLLHARRPTDDNDGRFFGKCLRSSVGYFEPADAIGDADGPKTAHASVGIGGESGALLVTSIDNVEFAFGEQVVKTEDVIAWQPKDMAHPMGVKALYEVLPYGK